MPDSSHPLLHVHVYVDVYTYKCYSCIRLLLHTHTYISTYIHTYIHTYMHTCIHAYMHAYIHTHLLTYIHTYIHTYILAYIHIRTYIRTYIHTYMLMSHDGVSYAELFRKASFYESDLADRICHSGARCPRPLLVDRSKDELPKNGHFRD